MSAIFRCDATWEIGFGHLSRCIALAEAFRLSGVKCVFAGLFDEAAIDQLIAARFDCLELVGAVNTPIGELEFYQQSALFPYNFLVIDSYRVNVDYLEKLRLKGEVVVLFDDFGTLDSYPCDVILNFTVEAENQNYPKGPTKLLGPEYLPARRPLVEMRPHSLARDRSGTIRNVLIAIGGSDPKGIASRLVGILHRDAHEICLKALVTNDPGLDSMLDDFLPGSEVLPRQPDLSTQLVWADAAITGGGLIKYESAFMTVPVAALAQNEGQAEESKAMARAGLVVDLGLADLISDLELSFSLKSFLSDAATRFAMVRSMSETFPSDPAAHAARAILQTVRH